MEDHRPLLFAIVRPRTLVTRRKVNKFRLFDVPSDRVATLLQDLDSYDWLDDESYGIIKSWCAGIDGADKLLTWLKDFPRKGKRKLDVSVEYKRERQDRMRSARW